MRLLVSRGRRCHDRVDEFVDPQAEDDLLELGDVIREDDVPPPALPEARQYRPRVVVEHPASAPVDVALVRKSGQLPRSRRLESNVHEGGCE
jgi:hypothetical protein